MQIPLLIFSFNLTKTRLDLQNDPKLRQDFTKLLQQLSQVNDKQANNIAKFAEALLMPDNVEALEADVSVLRNTSIFIVYGITSVFVLLACYVAIKGYQYFSEPLNTKPRPLAPVITERAESHNDNDATDVRSPDLS